MHFSEGIFLQRTSGTWRREDKHDQIKESAESDLLWCKSPWGWSYSAPWALFRNSREALDGTPCQSPERKTLMKCFN